MPELTIFKRIFAVSLCQISHYTKFENIIFFHRLRPPLSGVLDYVQLRDGSVWVLQEHQATSDESPSTHHNHPALSNPF